mmetsp:Transcript_1182/g.1927  ORF Transcript_1182/g.1927 Transcript_1182/m.1927 type:complete len:144 (-) Transcript_1182:171-602(-)|eukprot:CAMPEP_0185025724 /NCGR_PEP_ID=MMETSP1103-20130426/8973_1 /TAXON_ID=36769 /ORGANISM="Paraphysomonas bandaiensis, Strain Caron Lab Isolate" /LENGTH=143 /DNA_ID=CAMNT_0027559015 /DNA_START=38 /DNA_END=469 /DNA_ORIENTATION=-
MSFNPNSAQDWTPVVVTKSAKNRNSGKSQAQIIAQAKRSGQVTTERKFASGENKSAHSAVGGNLAKLENETEEFKHATVDRSLSQAIQQARLARKMTQKQLATAINEKPQIIQQYESGQAIPNPQIISKLERALGARLPRKKK